MPTLGQRLDGLCYVAWDLANARGKTGDSGNHQLRLVRDGLEILPQNLPSEVDSTGCPGLYKISLTDAEMSGNVITLAGTSTSVGVIIVPVQITTSGQAAAAFSTTSVSSARIWTDSQLAQWSEDALGQIASDVNCIYVREGIEIQSGNAFYTLAPYVRTVRRVTWRGRSLFAVSWTEINLLAPTTSGFGTPIGVPRFYAMSPTSPYSIRLFPIPNESFSATGFDPYSPQPNQPNCIVDFYRVPEESGINALPKYILRRTLKAYVLWKAFAAEGKGQDLKASQFYLSKYQFLIEYFRHINEGCFIAKRYSLDDATLLQRNFRIPKPVLGSNFERIYY